MRAAQTTVPRTQDPQNPMQHRPCIVPWPTKIALRRAGRSTGSTKSHRSSVSSQRPAINIDGDLRASPVSQKSHLQMFVYEMVSGNRI